MSSYNVAEAKAHLSEILKEVCSGQEVVLTRRGKPIARVVAIGRTSSLLGAGENDPNINRAVLEKDTWRNPMSKAEAKNWYE